MAKVESMKTLDGSEKDCRNSASIAEVGGETILERCSSESGLSRLPCSTCSTERPTNRSRVQAREQRRSVFRHIEPLLALHRLFPC